MKIFDNILIFENERVDDFYPFNIMHCIWELRTGALKQFERIEKIFPDSLIHYKGRQLHLNSFQERFNKYEIELSDGNLLAIDSAVIFNKSILKEIKKHIEFNPAQNLLFKNKDTIFSFYVSNSANTWISENSIFNFNEFVEVEIESVKFLNYLWDTLDNVGVEINNDFEFYINESRNQFYHHVYFLEHDNIVIGKNVKIMPNAVLDASEGAIIIEDNVQIMPQSTIVGPCYIGKNSVIKIGAKIYPNTSIGEFCKIGGEVENSIVHSYSNKQHEGFLGHSYICEWVNLGADTNNSDLKNTYSEIKMRLPHKTVKTGRIFLGLMCGDHTKTAINTQFNTGTIAGIGGVLFESGFLSTTIPSFAWGGVNISKKYDLFEALLTAEKVMNRRSKTLTKSEKILIKNEYDK